MAFPTKLVPQCGHMAMVIMNYYGLPYRTEIRTGVVCVEKSLSISALIANIDDLRSSIFHRLDVAISTI